MRWSCRRPGCGREAEVCISYDAVACQVWLDPISESPSSGQPVCAAQARRLRAPRGWIVMDRRSSQSALLTPAGASDEVTGARPRSTSQRRRLPRGWGQFDAPRLEFVVDEEVECGNLITPPSHPVLPEPVLPEMPVVREPALPEEPVASAQDAEPPVEVLDASPPEPEEAVPAEPVHRPTAKRPPRRPRTAEPATLGAPKGRLLSRAFEAAGPQRSAITEALIPGSTEPEPQAVSDSTTETG